MMLETEKLRARLKNVARGVTEYRMTVSEAKALLTEIDEMQNRVTVPLIQKHETEAITTRIMDGGTF